jgi:hypothetical protein
MEYTDLMIDMFEFAKLEFNSKLTASFDEKLFIENELQKYVDFENRAKELQKEVYTNDSILDNYQSQFENKFGLHYSEFEYLRMITGYYHYPERGKNKTFYFTPGFVKNIMLKKYIQEIYKKYESTPDNQLTGFTCNLHPDKVKEIFNLMFDSKQISGNLTDFQAMFANTSTPVKNPVKWLILDNRGTNPGRGNQTALFVFLELVLKKVSNQDLIKSKDLFIDEKGTFIKNKLLRPDKSKLKKYGFETQLKDILKKADQPKKQ